MLQSLLIQHNQKADRTFFESTFAKHSLAIESLAMHVKSIEITLRQNAPLARDEIAEGSQHAYVATGVASDKFGTKIHEGQNLIGCHASATSSEWKLASAEQARQNLPTQKLQDGPGNLKNGKGLEIFTETCTPQARSALFTSSTHSIEQHLDARLLLFLEICADTVLAVLKNLPLKANVVLQHVVVTVLALLQELLRSLPHVILFLRLLRQIPRAVSLVCHDNIRFEDALGRMQSLQYQHFRHWTVFEECLRCTFKGAPGMQKVLQRQFVLKSPRAPQEFLDATNWEKYASPGMVVTMAISISTILTSSGRCPWGCATRRAAASGPEAYCTGCNMTFSVMPFARTDTLRSLRFVGNRSRPRTICAIRMRKRVPAAFKKSSEHEKRERRDSATSRLETQSNVDRAKVSNLLRYESHCQQQEEHRLEQQEIIHYKRVHLVEDTVLKWTWTLYDHPHRPWHWAWHVELPEVRAEWKNADYWDSVSHDDLDQIVDEQISKKPDTRGSESSAFYSGVLGREIATKLAFPYSQEPPRQPYLHGRTYTMTYKGSLSSSDNRLVVIKLPFIHLLAVKPLTPHRIRSVLAIPKVECDQLLWIFGRDCAAYPEKKELQEVSYKELDVWGFPYSLERERHLAIERSVQAFDILRIGRLDNIWQLLLPMEQRGKGICLSKRSSD